MPSSEYDYIAIYDIYGLQKRFQAPSLRALAQMLNISRSTTMLLAGSGEYLGKMPIRIEKRRKQQGTSASATLGKCARVNAFFD